jgi:type III pantothenate kinase
MIVTLDIGNTSIKGGVFDGPDIDRVFGLDVGAPHRNVETGADAWIRALREVAVGGPVTRAGLASVVPEATPAAREGLEALTGTRATVISPRMPLPFRLDYDTPGTLGADRLAAAAAAWVRFGRSAASPPDGGSAPSGPPSPRVAPRSVLTVDAGTAVTYEVVHRDGVYLGGAIGAGPALMQRGLRGGTAQLPAVPLALPTDPVGRSTRSSLQSGVLWGFIDAVRGMIDRLAETCPDDPVVVLTGGWNEVLADHLDTIDHVVPHLVLDGVRVLMEGMEGPADSQAGAT